ncbi:MAG: hypothetical protein JWM96_1374 [Alphaproteobacteria bacterium]|nr:hypothetical protein [Alphaproteobacteria bacterium]
MGIKNGGELARSDSATTAVSGKGTTHRLGCSPPGMMVMASNRSLRPRVPQHARPVRAPLE